MDKIWSVLAMPIGVFACFTPVLIAWIRTEMRNQPRDKEKDRAKSST